MENWGLITYREADLLFDTQRSSEVAKQRVAVIIAHELAHQWFGNICQFERNPAITVYHNKLNFFKKVIW